MIGKREAVRRAKFFAEYLFGFKKIPPIKLVTNREMEEMLKEHAENLQIFERRSADVSGWFVYSDIGTSLQDDCELYINTTRCKDIDEFNSTLIHELLHYVLWWQGYDCDDDDRTFETRLKELGLSSNRDIVWHGKYHSKKPANAEKLKEYEDAYQEHIKKQTA